MRDDGSSKLRSGATVTHCIPAAHTPTPPAAAAAAAATFLVRVSASISASISAFARSKTALARLSCLPIPSTASAHSWSRSYGSLALCLRPRLRRLSGNGRGEGWLAYSISVERYLARRPSKGHRGIQGRGAAGWARAADILPSIDLSCPLAPFSTAPAPAASLGTFRADLPPLLARTGGDVISGVFSREGIGSR